MLFVIGGTASVKAIEQAVNAMKHAVSPGSVPVKIPTADEAQKREHEEKKKENEAPP